MPGSLSAAPITSAAALTATINPMSARLGFFPGDFPGASAYPGFIWGYGVIDADPIVSLAGLFPPFYPGSTTYPGRGSTLGATPIT